MKSVRVAAAVIKDNDRVFATARGYGEYKGWWEFPGGKIEAGETPQEALVREIKEELTAEIEVHELIKTIEYDYPKFHLSMDCFYAEVVQGDLVLKEAEEARWLSKDELDSVKWLPADRELIDMIRKPTDGTIDYYNKNAEDFANETADIEFSDMQDSFLSMLKSGAAILDFGCGSGRDTRYFLQKGYQVTAIDGSAELCRIAEEKSGIPVIQMDFNDFDEHDKYDGIWACSSILHLPKQELECVLLHMEEALHREGIIYSSFKYGDFSGPRNGRFFTDFTEESFRVFVSKIDSLTIEKMWITNDVRSGKQDEKWLNIILRTKRR